MWKVRFSRVSLIEEGAIGRVVQVIGLRAAPIGCIESPGLVFQEG